jgi:hypothetical protein
MKAQPIMVKDTPWHFTKGKMTTGLFIPKIITLTSKILKKT